MKATVRPVKDGLLVLIHSPAGGVYIRYVESFSFYYQKFTQMMNIRETTVLQ